jgi:two-component system cell cycle response regulator DivK
MEKAIHILIVEDSEDERDMYAYYLSRKGYRISMAGNGKEGVGKAFEVHPDLILMDLWLPAMGGWEATTFLKANERTKQCLIVVITGHAAYQPSTLECDGWLTKPCPLDRLDTEIERVLENRA